MRDAVGTERKSVAVEIRDLLHAFGDVNLNLRALSRRVTIKLRVVSVERVDIDQLIECARRLRSLGCSQPSASSLPTVPALGVNPTTFVKSSAPSPEVGDTCISNSSILPSGKVTLTL